MTEAQYVLTSTQLLFMRWSICVAAYVDHTAYITPWYFRGKSKNNVYFFTVNIANYFYVHGNFAVSRYEISLLKQTFGKTLATRSVREWRRRQQCSISSLPHESGTSRKVC